MKKKSPNRIWIFFINITDFLWNHIKIIWAWILKYHEGLQVVLTIIAIGLAYFLWIETQHQVQIARDSIKIQERIAKIETKAYISIKIDSIQCRINELLKIYVSFTNFGKSPANNFRTKVRARFGFPDIDQAFIDSLEHYNPKYQLSGAINVEETQRITLVTDITITERKHIDIIQKNRPIYFAGISTFENMFGDIDTTRFCFKIVYPYGSVPFMNYNTIK